MIINSRAKRDAVYLRSKNVGIDKIVVITVAVQLSEISRSNNV